ncbi:tetratricopeptide repeat protein [Flavobacterium sp.]|uniref:tetratricopeptide repeat protein n=1 Tax=Flavobacterium sp. TaxID=239 RepID=UPI0026256477|nr:tetratricopeptide repeat protein [Flavobacterium sp.]
MKLLHRAILLFFISISGLSYAQNMNEGFSNLEKGEFSKAEIFFKGILKDYPTNKTARLCYARAVGLNNQPEQALQMFVDLMKEYPGDLEIELNHAEALLWNKKFSEAKGVYSNLVRNNPTNFVAHLGFANTLSNLKEFPDALAQVNTALELSPANPGALISRKYIKLGYANDKVKEKKYAEAEAFYNEILSDFPNDKETLLNKANLYLITKDIAKGKATYSLLAAGDPVLALNGLALIEHIDGNDKTALLTAEKAVEAAKAVTDQNLKKQASERYVQALIWNKKFKAADAEIKTLNAQYGNENWLLALAATLSIYKSDFKDSIQYYESILGSDKSSFDGNLGVANAYYASGEIDKAYAAVKTTLDIFPGQNDATNFLKKLNQEHTPSVEEKLSYSFDNGNNTAVTSRTLVTVPLSTKWSVNTTYQFRKTGNKNTNIKAESNDFLAGVGYKFHPKISFNTEIGVTSASSTSSNYTEALVAAYFKIKPYKLQDLEIGYKRELQNFNTDLIDQQIAANNYYLDYNIGTNVNLGWFTQYYYTTQTDNNKRNLLFTSLYYNILSKPVLKTGFNYQFISFKDQLPTIYFSPKKFNAYEIFVDFLKDEMITTSKSVFYNANAAAGYQYIEDNDKQVTYRIQLRFGYKFSDRFLANIYGGKSNIASASVAGFTYTEIGLRLKWLFCPKPIFKT